MKRLIIETNGKNKNFIVLAVFLTFTSILLIGICAVVLTNISAVLDDFKGENGSLPWVLLFTYGLMFSWLLIGNIQYAFYAFKSAFFNGPVATIQADGIMDHFYNNRILSWGEVERIDVLPNELRIRRKNIPLKFKVMAVFGQPYLRYNFNHLSVGSEEVKQFLLSAGPKNIL